MKRTKEEILNEIYSHFPESEDKNETMCLLLTDCFETGIGYWNTKHPKTKSTAKEYYYDNIWEDVKNGESLTFGDEDNMGELNLTNIARALNQMKEHSPESYQDIQDENWDALTCDEFFQTVIFGELVFG